MTFGKPLVSIVIPAYNEERYLANVINSIAEVTETIEDFLFEVLVVDDGSTDGTSGIASSFPHVRLVKQKNQGKGAAVQRGISAALGRFILIQDADLEYEVNDYKGLLNALKEHSMNRRVAVFGSRTIYEHGDKPGKYKYRFKPVLGQQLAPWIGNIVLSLVVALLYGRWVSDTLTAYKLYSREFFTSNKIVSSGFEADHEITAKLLKQGFRIIEVPVAYSPRSVEEGKKIRTRDGFIALKVYLFERFKAL
jgi:glycosyltransferase involved in cell wall biosynthesis